MRADELPPLVAGIGPLPRPQRFYFRFEAPIETRKWAGRAHSQTACLELRAEVAQAIERGIKALKQVRRRDPEAALVVRLMHGLGDRMPERREGTSQRVRRSRDSTRG